MRNLKDLKKPQKEKYRAFAYKNEQKNFEAIETNDVKEAIEKITEWLKEERSIGVFTL